MATPFSPEHIARLRDGARRLAGRAAEHESHVQNLLAAAELNLDDARAALLADDSKAQADARSRALHSHLMRSSAHVDSTRELCLSARQNHLAIDRLVAEMCPDEELVGPPSGGHAVLVADDYQDSREWLSRVLKNAGFVVQTASNGLEALIAAYEMQPAVIVMAVMMPVLDGLEAARLIKAIDALSRTRVIAYTTGAPQPIATDVFTAVLRKPAPPDLIVETVKHWAAAS